VLVVLQHLDREAYQLKEPQGEDISGRPTTDRTARARPLEVRLDDGIKVVIHGVTDPETAAAALKRAIKKLVADADGRGAEAA